MNKKEMTIRRIYVENLKEFFEDNNINARIEIFDDGIEIYYNDNIWTL
jgi:hypothetical protein